MATGMSPLANNGQLLSQSAFMGTNRRSFISTLGALSGLPRHDTANGSRNQQCYHQANPKANCDNPHRLAVDHCKDGASAGPQSHAQADAHNSEVDEELHKLIGRLVAAGLRAKRLESLKGTLLHREVGFDIHVCSRGVFMAEPECDDRDVDAGLQQVQRW